MWWLLREDLRTGQQQLLPDDELTADLTARKYKVTPKGQIKAEPKDDMRKRGISSPDRADALMLARDAQKYARGGIGLRVLRVDKIDEAAWRPLE